MARSDRAFHFLHRLCAPLAGRNLVERSFLPIGLPDRVRAIAALDPDPNAARHLDLARVDGSRDFHMVSPEGAQSTPSADLGPVFGTGQAVP